MASKEVINKIENRIKQVMTKHTSESKTILKNWCWGYLTSLREFEIITEEELDTFYELIGSLC